MLGIIFTGGNGPEAQAAGRLIEKEVSGERLIIAADFGLALAQSIGLTPDWIIGDMDSCEDESLLDAYPQERIIRHVKDKDYTDTELAFSHALEQGCDNIWIIGGGGGRIDHLFAIRSLFERDVFPQRWVTDSEDICCVSMNAACFSLDKDALVSVFPLGDGPWEAKSTGLKWPLDGLSWNRGFFGLSNVAIDGKFSIRAESGRFMVITPLVYG